MTMMTDMEIIEADWQKNNSDHSLHNCKLAYTMAERRGWKKYRAGNSFLFIRPEEDGLGHFHFVNADRMSDFVKNVIDCFAQAKADGFKELTTNFTNPKIMAVAEAVPQETSVTEREYQGKNQYWMTVRL